MREVAGCWLRVAGSTIASVKRGFVRILFVLCLLASLVACQKSPEKRFSGPRALQHVKAQCAFGPRPVGSAANRRTGDYIARVLKDNGWEVEFQDFSELGLPVRNVIGKKGQGPVTILGAHYDTRPVADRDPLDRTQPIMGANDGGSGTAVLLELSRVLGSTATDSAQIWLAFFDAEDRGELNGWAWCVGSQYMADHLFETAEGQPPKERPRLVIIADMVGGSEQHFYYDWYSSLSLQERLWQIAAEKGYQEHFTPEHRYSVYDDHVPFANLGIPAAVIVDLDYAYWHTRDDTLDKISADSLQRVGDILETYIEGRRDNENR